MPQNTKLKVALRESNKSQVELASTLGMNRTRVCLAANGWQKLRAEEEMAVAEFLAVPVEQLFPSQ